MTRPSTRRVAPLLLSAVLLLPGVTPGVAHAQNLNVTRVFGPEVETGPYKHPACMTELSNGDLYLVYYGGEGEYATGTAVYGSRLKAGSTTWSPPEPIARDPFRSLGNAVVWQAPGGLVWLFYVVRYGDTWSTSRIQAKVSRDEGATWSDAFMLHEGAGMMVRNQPIVLHDGSYLLPIYHETGHDTEAVGPDSTSRFLRYDAKTHVWKELGAIRSRTGNIQPAVVELAPDHLVAYCRRGGNYKPTKEGWMIRAESRDGGVTWTEGQNASFPNPNAALDFIELANGHLLLAYNDSMTARTPLAIAISTDGDRTYPHRRNIAEGPGDFAYPIAFQGRDGRIHVVFTSDRRRVINHAVFDESWVTGR